MNAASPKSSPCLGFLTVIENAELGLIGGYLLLNAAGRPLEFHCTAPVKANRTQEILYGPTLKPYLYGEQIGQTLLTKSKLTPVVICTDRDDMLAVRECTEIPVVMVLDGQWGRESLAENDSLHGIAVTAKDSRPLSFSLGLSRAVTAPHYPGDEQVIRQSWPAQADHLDLLEPFSRIREALDEAQKAARQAA
jgi:hypothetical protein